MSNQKPLLNLSEMIALGTSVIVPSDKPIHFRKSGISIYEMQKLTLIRHHLTHPTDREESESQESVSGSVDLHR